MMRKTGIKDTLAAVLAAAGIVVLAFAFSISRTPGDTSAAARRVGRLLDRRVAVLEKGMRNPESPIPSDMVIYRYVQDTLKYWNNQFPVFNDDISERTVFPRLMDPRMNFQSPLLEIADSLTFVNLGDKWYLARSEDDGYNKVIGGIEISNSRLRLSDRFSIKPLSESGGSEVRVDGRPQFKVHYDSLGSSVTADFGLVCTALVLVLAAGILFLAGRRNIRRFQICSAALLAVSAVLYLWSRNADTSIKLFSPVVYAGGAVLSSLGSVVIINLAVFLLVGSAYMVRSDISRKIRGKVAVILFSVMDVALAAGIAVYSFIVLKSIIYNSSITLEAFKVEDLSVWSVVTCVSFLMLLLCIPMLVQMLRPAMTFLFGRHFDAFSRKNRVGYAVTVSLALVLLTSVLGFRKEQDRLEVWANRLAVERDISLEMQLRQVEGMIASDMFIPTFATMYNGETAVKNLISDNYFRRFSQNYNISVQVMNENTPRRRALMINSRLRDGEPIAEDSHFLYCESPSGQPRYCGLFSYLSEQSGLTQVLVEIEPKSGSQEKGYMSLLGISAPGRFNLPAKYAYVRYKNSSLVVNKGNYPYPTTIPAAWLEIQRGTEPAVFKEDSYTHFIYPIAEDESVVISRPATSVTSYAVAFVFTALMAFFSISFFIIGRRRRPGTGSGYYKTRITWVVMTALVLTLVAMAVVSAVYVYRRNLTNLNDLMSDKVTSIRTMLQDEMFSTSAQQQTAPAPPPGFPEEGEAPVIGGGMGFERNQLLMSPQTMSALENVGNNTNSDITLFTPEGKLAISTFTQVFERLYDGSRIDREAYENIVLKGKRHFIHKEKVGGIDCYNMYAPITGRNNTISAIMCSPYTGGETGILEMDALKHLMTIFTLFLLLLILARFAVYSVLDRMFKPLNEMGRRMNNAELASLEHLEYDRNDEITGLVDSYNRMVDDLSESTRRLAQAERDKAWSGMARQVAHEIKNPLTPMKLQIQRIIRLKQKGDPQWQDKFDEVTTVLLDHIEILSDTANQFSTFAKLYSEEHTVFDLDKVLKEEVSMYDNREGVHFDYIGLEGAAVSGPKPQLTRVFVNLFNNAVQALEGREDGHILVSLRHSSEDGYYDIVVEDNGPGVPEENVDRLFAPNFTTKNGGSGLGLAISRSILERCDAVISYSRSFQLSGACFTVHYPRKDR